MRVRTMPPNTVLEPTAARFSVSMRRGRALERRVGGRPGRAAVAQLGFVGPEIHKTS
jgi:hypothetical protein